MTMVFRTDPITDERDMMVAIGATGFVRRHGAGLAGLLDILSETETRKAVGKIEAQEGRSALDPIVVQQALQRIVATIWTTAFSALDAHSERHCRDLVGQLRWYGARLSDLLAGFSSAEPSVV